MHELQINTAIKNLLISLNILPGYGKSGFSEVKRIRFSSRLCVSDWTRHPVRERAMVVGSLGYMSYAHSPVHRYSTGGFCSIASNVSTMGDDHPWQRASSHPLSYGRFYRDAAIQLGAASLNMVAPYDGSPKPTVVGHDVWIGGNVTIAGGIKIGTGAVIAAGAIVTKDVPPYAIVGGVPAKVIKYRFPDHIVDRLLLTKWWEYPLNALSDFDFRDPDTFCAEFEQRKEKIIPRKNKLVAASDLLALA